MFLGVRGSSVLKLILHLCDGTMKWAVFLMFQRYLLSMFLNIQEDGDSMDHQIIVQPSSVNGYNSTHS
jgi:hypothetical protein